jgi:MFS family permease
MPRFAVPTLLGARRDFRLLFLASLGSSIGTWLAFVALVVDVYDRTGSAAWVSALLVVEFAPIVVIGLLIGPLIDRLPRRRVLIAADLARAGVFCALPFTTSVLQIILLALVAGIATSFFQPAVYAGLPSLVEEDDLTRANGLLQSAMNLTNALGPVLGGLLVAWASPAPAYWFNAASFVLSATLVYGIRRNLEEGKAESQGHWHDLVEGLALLRTSRPLRAVVVTWCVAMAASAGISVSEIVLAKDVFDAGGWGYGLMLSAMGAGLVLGGLWAAEWVDQHGVRGPYVGSIAVMAAGIAGVAVAPNVWVAAGLLVLAGLGNGVALVCNAVLVQRGVPDRARGRAFTVAMSLSYAALGLGMIAAGPLTAGIGAREVWVVAGVLLAVAGVIALALTRGVGVGSEAKAAEPAVPS